MLRSARSISRSGRLSAILVAVLLAATAACGGSGGEDTGEGDESSAEQAAHEPVTIEHRYGSTTIEQRPQRIVALDSQWTDVLVALDAPLVGAALDPSIESGRYPWQDGVLDGVEDIEVTDAIPYEAVAALRPDLIVITWGAASEADYERLRDIAPTIPSLDDAEVGAWQDMATVTGEILGEQEQAAELIDAVDSEVVALAAELPKLDGATYALANFVPGDAIYVVADPDDGAARLFAQLGMSIDPDLVAVADGASGRAQLSLERADELNADVLVLLTNGAEPDELVGYESLPAVQSGAVALLDVADVSGLNTPTPLSVPYSLDKVRPALVAAAAARS